MSKTSKPRSTRSRSRVTVTKKTKTGSSAASAVRLKVGGKTMTVPSKKVAHSGGTVVLPGATGSMRKKRALDTVRRAAKTRVSEKSYRAFMDGLKDGRR